MEREKREGEGIKERNGLKRGKKRRNMMEEKTREEKWIKRMKDIRGRRRKTIGVK